MPVSWSERKWLRLPSRIALLFGLGALSAAGVRANASEPPQGATFGSQTDDIVLRAEGGRIYLSEHGAALRELTLGDDAAARRLRQLLDEHGGTDVRLDSTRLAGAGGAGFHWTPAEKTDPPASGVDLNAPNSPARAGGVVTPAQPGATPAQSGLKTGRRAAKG